MGRLRLSSKACTKIGAAASQSSFQTIKADDKTVGSSIIIAAINLRGPGRPRKRQIPLSSRWLIWQRISSCFKMSCASRARRKNLGASRAASQQARFPPQGPRHCLRARAMSWSKQLTLFIDDDSGTPVRQSRERLTYPIRLD